ncbi:MAG: DUF4910 domain-containing protein [Elusimicrobia bacterium]|nr:DUF4910 domain-containing protein [Elusimicrobiota bacterium]
MSLKNRRTTASPEQAQIGGELYALAKELFPICRSITGEGFRQTLKILQREAPGLAIHSVPSGTKAFDWEVPDEWNIRAASIRDSKGRKVVDFADSNLHVVGYSTPIDQEMSLEELQPHLHSLPKQPDAIPYVTSYYNRTWGFCLPHRQRKTLKKGRYRVRIDSALRPGELNYGEILLPGRLKQEILLSTYCCHPSTANNEVSGPVVTARLARWLAEKTERRYSYRIIFIPETIGSIVYLSRHLAALKEKVAAGFNVTCVGDDRVYSYLPSRRGDTLADRAALHAISAVAPKFKRYSYLDRGSDERQYCSPGADLPVATLMRSKYGEYPEYHTSKDNLSLISPKGLYGGFALLRRALEILEANETWRATAPCEPQLGRRGLYPTLSKKGEFGSGRRILDFLAYCDGTNDLLAVAETIGADALELAAVAEKMAAAGLIRREE